MGRLGCLQNSVRDNRRSGAPLAAAGMVEEGLCCLEQGARLGFWGTLWVGSLGVTLRCPQSLGVSLLQSGKVVHGERVER